MESAPPVAPASAAAMVVVKMVFEAISVASTIPLGHALIAEEKNSKALVGSEGGPLGHP